MKTITGARVSRLAPCLAAAFLLGAGDGWAQDAVERTEDRAAVEAPTAELEAGAALGDFLRDHFFLGLPQVRGAPDSELTTPELEASEREEATAHSSWTWEPGDPVPSMLQQTVEVESEQQVLKQRVVISASVGALALIILALLLL